MLERFLSWLSRQSTSRLLGLLLGDTRQLEAVIARQQAELNRLRTSLASWQDKWLERQGFTGVAATAAGAATTATLAADPLLDDEELRRRDEQVEIEERAERAAADEEYFEYAQQMAGEDSRWVRVVQLAESKMERVL